MGAQEVRGFALKMLVAIFCAATLLAISPAPARADKALVAVATNFAEVIRELKPVFEQASGHRLQTATGSTGKLYAQIKHGAPFHVLLAADTERPRRLVSEGDAEIGSQFTYATGRLTLWSLGQKQIGPDGRDRLTSAGLRHIAIANPKLAPYGMAAEEALRTFGLWEALSPKIVMGQNIGQTFSMVATGNAELGFVALSAVLSPRNTQTGSRWDIPANAHRPIRQDAVLLKAGRGNTAARTFLRFLKTPQARVIIKRFGYGID